jgi:hypothetical protein
MMKKRRGVDPGESLSKQLKDQGEKVRRIARGDGTLEEDSELRGTHSHMAGSSDPASLLPFFANGACSIDPFFAHNEKRA